MLVSGSLLRLNLAFPLFLLGLFSGFTLGWPVLIFALVMPLCWIPFYWFFETKTRPVKIYHFLPSLPACFSILWTALMVMAKKAWAPFAWLPVKLDWSWVTKPMDIALFVCIGLSLIILVASYKSDEGFPWHVFKTLLIQVAICGLVRLACAWVFSMPF